MEALRFSGRQGNLLFDCILNVIFFSSVLRVHYHILYLNNAKSLNFNFSLSMLQSGSRMDRAIEMLVAAERALVQNRCLTIPCVYVRPDVDKTTASKVKEVVRRHQGTIAEAEADATHIVYPPVDPLEEEYARPCLKRDRSVLLHWYYFPDSHDSWTTLDLPWDFSEGSIGIGTTSGRYNRKQNQLLLYNQS